jgi:hypothetical protein
MEPTEAQFQPFDDPGLKRAVGRAWGGERCPAAVRARVLSAVAATRPPEGRSPAVIGAPLTTRPSFWHQPWLRYGLAAAAMMLLGFGIAWRLDSRDGGIDGVGGIPGTEVTFTSTVPAPIARGMLESHERCSKYPNHSSDPQLSGQDFPAIRRRLEEHLGFPVLAGNVEEALGRNGWSFKGAAVCTVGGVSAAHLVFVRQGQAISVFSLPPSSCRHADGQPHECEDPNPDHPAAVFVWSDGVHCVVGSSADRSISVDEVRSVLEHLRSTLPDPAAR